MTPFILKEETFKIIGCCMEVHRQLGRGFSEVIYKDALQREFRDQSIHFQREQAFSVFYKGEQLPHNYYADFVVFEQVILELKVASGISEAHIAQTLNYLKVSGCKVGLVINFNADRLEYQRLIL